jgi:hypothetical protein
MVEWRTDWKNAPKNNIKFLVLKKDYDGSPIITTAYYYWYTENAFLDNVDCAYWALHNAVTDEPLDEEGPPELQDMKWAVFPKVK